uniref:Protein kinase domain-containing protein n=1 Tax=Caenorhabditis tropicalis TaxID=1561998 RepID=A0A1I7UER3_9PELO
MGKKYRRGHDYESISHHFSDDDLADLKPRKLFVDKWIILKKVEKRGKAHCYQVCDKSIQNFGILYLEQGEDNVTSLSTQLDFSLQQFSLGYSHRFTNVIDANVINNHVFYMVLRIRPGPSVDRLLRLVQTKMSPITVSFIAIDILTVFELMNASGYVLRNFDPKQWKLDTKTRMFYLDDTTDIGVSSDKRHRSIDEIHILNAETLDLHWTSGDLSYAPISYIINGPMHRMTELDMFEMFIYLIWDWARGGTLPWKDSKSEQRTLEMKKEFLETIPSVMEEFKDEHDHWFNTAINNLGSHLKVAKKAQEKLERQAVRGGAWCPNGPRAGALLSIINYRRLIEDFHKIVRKGRPEWTVHWRDAKLDWDTEVELNDQQKSMITRWEMRQQSAQLVDEWQRLRAAREHYIIRKEHAETEQEKNQIAIDRYLKGDPDDPELQKQMEERIEVLRAKRQKWRDERAAVERKIKEEEEEMKALEEKKKEIKEEIPDGEEEYTPPQHFTTAATKAARRQRVIEANLELVKEEEPEEEEEEEDVKEPMEKRGRFYSESETENENRQMIEEFQLEEKDVKLEEPDDYDV